MGKKILYVFLALLALPISLGLQFVVLIPVAGVTVMRLFAGGLSNLSELPGNILDRLLGQDMIDLTAVFFALSCILVFGLWYFFGFRRERTEEKKRMYFSIGILLGLLFLAVAFQFFCSILVGITDTLAPGSLETYEQLEELSGMDEPTVMMFLYGVILGPIGEELIFRGVAFHYLKRTFPFVVANLIQAILFGIFHMNLLQGVFTTVIGFLFGFVVKEGGSILYSVLLHIIFNGLAFSGILDIGAETRLYDYLWIPVMLFAFALGLILYFEKMRAVHLPLQEKQGSSDI